MIEYIFIIVGVGEKVKKNKDFRSFLTVHKYIILWTLQDRFEIRKVKEEYTHAVHKENLQGRKNETRKFILFIALAQQKGREEGATAESDQ